MHPHYSNQPLQHQVNHKYPHCVNQPPQHFVNHNHPHCANQPLIHFVNHKHPHCDNQPLIHFVNHKHPHCANQPLIHFVNHKHPHCANQPLQHLGQTLPPHTRNCSHTYLVKNQNMYKNCTMKFKTEDIKAREIDKLSKNTVDKLQKNTVNIYQKVQKDIIKTGTKFEPESELVGTGSSSAARSETTIILGHKIGSARYGAAHTQQRPIHCTVYTKQHCADPLNSNTGGAVTQQHCWGCSTACQSSGNTTQARTRLCNDSSLEHCIF